MPTYKRLEGLFERGEGVWLYDTEGRRYLDALAGIAVCGSGMRTGGHARHPGAGCAPAAHSTSTHHAPAPTRRPPRRAERHGHVFFGNSGAEANECAIKIARMYGTGRTSRSRDHVMENSSTAVRWRRSPPPAAASAGGLRAAGERFVRARFGDLDELASIARNNSSSSRSWSSRSRASRHPRGAEVPGGAARAVRPARLAADAGRGADRQRAHRPDIRVPAHRDHARRTDHAKASATACDRRLPGARQGRRRVPCRQPRLTFGGTRSPAPRRWPCSTPSSPTSSVPTRPAWVSA